MMKMNKLGWLLGTLLLAAPAIAQMPPQVSMSGA
jgi:hypothetical protein